jgi:methionyl-tRNA synthetase
MGRYLLHEGCAVAFELVSAANAFVEERAPWKAAKDPARREELDDTLASLVRTLAVVSSLLSPFMPDKMAELWGQLDSGRSPISFGELNGLAVAGWRLAPPAALFPRLELGEARPV